MAPKGSRRDRIRHGTRKWVQEFLRLEQNAAGIMTSEIQKGVEKLSGSKIPPYSVYQALRTMVKRGEVKATRKGREFSYRILSGRAAAASAKAPKMPASDAPAAPTEMSTAVTVTAEAPAGGTPLVHTLAPGEVAILHVGESHVESATNEHGKLVLQKHPRPK